MRPTGTANLSGVYPATRPYGPPAVRFAFAPAAGVPADSVNFTSQFCPVLHASFPLPKPVQDAPPLPFSFDPKSCWAVDGASSQSSLRRPVPDLFALSAPPQTVQLALAGWPSMLGHAFVDEGYGRTATERHGNLRYPDLLGPDDPRLLEICQHAARVADRFGKEIRKALRKLGLPYEVTINAKSAASIYKKLRARHQRGQDYPLSKMTDVARGRINVTSNDLRETACLDKALRAYFNVATDCAESPNYLRRFIETPDRPYARSHLILRDESGNRFELQIGTQDFKDFNSMRAGMLKLSAVYKATSWGATVARVLSDEYFALQREVNLANLAGRSMKDDPALMARIEDFRREVERYVPHHVSALVGCLK